MYLTNEKKQKSLQNTGNLHKTQEALKVRLLYSLLESTTFLST